MVSSTDLDRTLAMTHPAARTVVITGGTGGIGLRSAVGIAKTGARVFVTGRDVTRGEAGLAQIRAESGNDNVALVIGDVSSIAGVDGLASELLAKTERIDVLVNNAGYLGNVPATSADGLEMHFAVTVLAPWRLAHVLLPALEAGEQARVVNVTGGDKPAAVDVDNLQAEKGFRGLMTYTHSKSILEAMSMALAREFEPHGVGVHIVFPGRASTAMTRSLTSAGLPGAMKLMMPFFKLFFSEDGGKSASKAARSTIWAATTPELDGRTGHYFDTNRKEASLHPSAYDLEHQRRIVDLLRRVAG